MATSSINIVLTQEQQNIGKIDKDRYIRLKQGLKSIGDGYNDWEVLMDMEFEATSNSKNCEYKDMINPKCYQEEDGVSNYKCVCGQQHLHHLTILEFNSELYILGSKCIKELDKIAEVKNLNPEIREKIGEWIKQIELYEAQRKFKKCLGCGQLRVSKTTKYKDPRRFLRCNKCILKKRVLCGECKQFKFHPKNSKKAKFYFKCESCYANAYLPPADDYDDFLSDSDED